MKILFISFFYEPETTVAAKRVSYWAQNFKLLDPASEVYVLTTTKNANQAGIDILLETSAEGSSFYSNLIRDKGVVWKTQIIEAINGSKIKEITHVVMSGGPFMYFDLQVFFKKKFGAKVILDYRDPFAINPRFNNNKFKIKTKQFFERKFNQSADLILSVNQYCLELLVGYKKNSLKYKVIPNGFNEKLVPKENIKAKKRDKKRIVYAGSFYVDPQNFTNAIAENPNWEFHHLGEKSELLVEANQVVEHGMKDYTEMLEFIGSCDAALIITNGEPFESTTKIYDYIAMGIPILVVTEGQFQSGAINDELKDYPTIWCKNKKRSIQEALNKIEEIEMKTIDVNAYSRGEGLQNLFQILKTLK